MHCDFCHAAIPHDAAHHHITLGMNDSSTAASTVEETSELDVCAACEPAVTARFDAFLAELWALRAPVPGEVPPTQRSPVDLLDAVPFEGGPTTPFDGMGLDEAADFLAESSS